MKTNALKYAGVEDRNGAQMRRRAVSPLLMMVIG
jgi:hypothetical protein